MFLKKYGFVTALPNVPKLKLKIKSKRQARNLAQMVSNHTKNIIYILVSVSKTRDNWFLFAIYSSIVGYINALGKNDAYEST